MRYFFLIERQSSFLPLLNLWHDGYTVFESTTKSGFYLRAVQRRLVMEQYDGTEKFKQEASFKTHKTIITGNFKIYLENKTVMINEKNLKNNEITKGLNQ